MGTLMIPGAGVATKHQHWGCCALIKYMKEQRERDRGRKGPLVVLYCWQKNYTDRCIWLSVAPMWGAISRMHFLEVCFCGDKSVNFKKKKTQKRAMIQKALLVMSLLSQKHHIQHHCLFVHEAIKQRKNQYIIYLSTCGRVQQSERNW